MIALHRTRGKEEVDAVNHTIYNGTLTQWKFGWKEPIDGVWHGHIVSSSGVKELNHYKEVYATSFTGKDDDHWTIVPSHV